MTPRDFGLTRSKVKVIVTLNVKMVSADYLEYYTCISQSSYVTCRLVMTSWWPLLILGSLGQRSRSCLPWMLKWFPLIILKTIYHKVFIFHMYITKSSYLTCRLAMTSWWPLLILGSLCQRSKFKGPWMSKWFLLIISKTIYNKVYNFHM